MKKENWIFLPIAIITIILLGLVAFINLDSKDPKTDELISSNSVKDTRTQEELPKISCSATICTKDDGAKIYCPQEHNQCKSTYDDCRLIPCDTESRQAEEKEDLFSYTEEIEDEEPSCTEEYNDCTDDEEELICKGSFKACSAAFDSCICGTEDSIKEEESLQPDFDSSQEVECDTGVFVCERTQLSMSGDVATSKVTCKGSFSECAIQYGTCECGNSSLTDFPTQYIGGVTDDGSSESANNYWCDYNDKQVPCNMLPENCMKKKNTCNKGNDIWITCDGSFEYCEKKYGECLCDVEMISSGFMTPSD